MHVGAQHSVQNTTAFVVAHILNGECVLNEGESCKRVSGSCESSDKLAVLLLNHIDSPMFTERYKLDNQRSGSPALLTYSI